MTLTKFMGEKPFDEKVYNQKPYTTVKEFRGSLSFTEFRKSPTGQRTTSSFSTTLCNNCHGGIGGPDDPWDSPFPEETLPELIIPWVPWDDWGNLDPWDDGYPWYSQDKGPTLGGGVFPIHEPEEPEEQKPPCTDLNETIKENLHGLKEVINTMAISADTTPHTENGIALNQNGGYFFLPGDPNTASINIGELPLNTQYDALLHTHYTGLLKGPSPADLMILYYLASNGYINDYNTFEFGIITSSGYVSISINNLEDFLDAFSGLNEGDLSTKYNDYNLINNYGYPTAHALSTLNYSNSLNKLLNDLNSGLSVSCSTKHQGEIVRDDNWYYYDPITETMKKC